MKENNSKNGKAQGDVTRRVTPQEKSSQKTESKFESNRIFILNDANAPRLCPALAKEVGLNESIFFLQLEFYICISGKEKQGELWIYGSIRDLVSIFPFWSIATINRTIQSLEKKNLIKIGNFNQKKYDKTRWFAINFEEAAKLKSITAKGSKWGDETRSEQNETGSEHNATPSAQKATTIPETSTESHTETSFSSEELSTGMDETEFEPSPPYKGSYEADDFRDDYDSEELEACDVPCPDPVNIKAGVRDDPQVTDSSLGAGEDAQPNDQTPQNRLLVPDTKKFNAEVERQARQMYLDRMQKWKSEVLSVETEKLADHDWDEKLRYSMAWDAAVKRGGCPDADHCRLIAYNQLYAEYKQKQAQISSAAQPHQSLLKGAQ